MSSIFGDFVVGGGFKESLFVVGATIFVDLIMLLKGLFLIVFVRVCSLFWWFSTALSCSFSVSSSLGAW